MWAREAWRARNDADPHIRLLARALLGSGALFCVLLIHLALNLALLFGAGA